VSVCVNKIQPKFVNAIKIPYENAERRSAGSKKVESDKEEKEGII
jgi:hypothetical protein